MDCRRRRPCRLSSDVDYRQWRRSSPVVLVRIRRPPLSVVYRRVRSRLATVWLWKSRRLKIKRIIRTLCRVGILRRMSSRPVLPVVGVESPPCHGSSSREIHARQFQQYRVSLLWTDNSVFQRRRFLPCHHGKPARSARVLHDCVYARLQTSSAISGRCRRRPHSGAPIRMGYPGTERRRSALVQSLSKGKYHAVQPLVLDAADAELESHVWRLPHDGFFKELLRHIQHVRQPMERNREWLRKLPRCRFGACGGKQSRKKQN